ncbi:MAG: hypothetical protein LJE84_04700 [Gammaproteobacteria bacterium]|jgi:hypothetical protein|nr:hypothetical protein [Gammaproteobacteria bacterium]
MLAGFILILAGILIAVFPELLSLIVASLLLFLGITVLAVAHLNKQHGRRYENSVVRVFLRM